jgi:HK97 family phage portal protein
LHGAAYALANRVEGKIVELIKLDCGAVTPDTDDNQEPIYKVTLKSGRVKSYTWHDILHVPTLGDLSAIKQVREAIGLALALEKHAAKLMGNGARPSGVIKAKTKLSDVAYERIKKSWRSTHTGENAGGIAILEDGAEFVPLTFSSVDMQFAEMRGQQVVEVARALGVPPNLIFDFSRATWANAETASQAYLTLR